MNDGGSSVSLGIVSRRTVRAEIMPRTNGPVGQFERIKTASPYNLASFSLCCSNEYRKMGFVPVKMGRVDIYSR